MGWRRPVHDIPENKEALCSSCNWELEKIKLIFASVSILVKIAKLLDVE